MSVPLFIEQGVRVSGEDRSGRMLQLLDELQMIAWQHASEFRVAFDELREKGWMWVLTRLYLSVPEDLPEGQPLRLRTWPTGSDRRFAYRDFALELGGRPLASATSTWAVLVRDSRELVPMDEVLGGVMPAELLPRETDFPGRAIPKLKQVRGRHAVAVGEGDLDVNGHVNNIRYLAWALESLPAEQRARRLVAADLMFRAECFAGDTILALHDCDGGEDTVTHLIARDGGEKEAVRLTTWWND